MIRTYLATAPLAASIFAFTASRLKLAPFCIGGNSMAVMASFTTSCWTHTNRQNSYLNQLKYCCAPYLVPLSEPIDVPQACGHVRVGSKVDVDLVRCDAH